MNKLKQIAFILFICSGITGCSTTAMLHSQYLNDRPGKKIITKELILCKAAPNNLSGLHNKVFSGQEIYLLNEVLYNKGVRMGTGCLDEEVPILVGTEIELKTILHRGYFEGSTTYAFGYIDHPIKNQKVAFETILTSKDQSGGCNNPNAPFNLTRTHCKRYFDNLEFPWK